MNRTHPNNLDLGFNDLPFDKFELETKSTYRSRRSYFVNARYFTMQ